ncbi:MAG TPA: DUF4328 domain-containing protein [Gemmatimonadales bacterium]|nr:DUF4328 domain-containing protein [Gemmatimonadales bacterium]
MPDDLSTVRRAEQTGARWTTYLLFACLALDAVAIVSGVSQRSLLVRAMAGAQLVPSEAAASAPPHGPIGTLQLVALAGTGIVWLVWLHRAYGNLTLIGSKRLRFNPSWAIGCWFIPFVNVVRAYQIMKDLWLRSESMNDRDAYDNLPAPALLSTWWGVSLTWGALALVLTLLARDAYSLEQLTNVTDLGLLVHAVGVVAAVLAMMVVRGIDRHQQRFRLIGVAA